MSFNSFPIPEKQINDPDVIALISGYFKPSNEVIINSETDFPTPVAGVITLESGKTYIINTAISISNSLSVPVGAFVQIRGTNAQKKITYTGTDAMFKITSIFGIVLLDQVYLEAPNGSFFDIARVSGTFYSISSIFANAVSCGTVKCATFTVFFCSFVFIGQGFTFENNATQVSISHTSFGNWKNEVNCVMAKYYGNIPNIPILDSRFTPKSNESSFYFDKTLSDNNSNILVNSCALATAGGNTFATNSLNQYYINGTFYGSSGGVDDSTAYSKQYFTNNALNTDVLAINTPALINAIWTNGDIDKQRIRMRDLITIDGNTDFITTKNFISGATENHGLVNGDLISFTKSVGSSLPLQIVEFRDYYVVNSTSSSFQISATLGGSPIDLSSNGSGTLYCDHDKGSSSSGWFIYYGIEPIRLAINGYVQVVTATGSTGDNIYIQPAKTSTTLIETLLNESPTVNVGTAKPDSIVMDNIIRLLNKEGVRFYVVNTTTTADVSCGKANINIFKI